MHAAQPAAEGAAPQQQAELDLAQWQDPFVMSGLAQLSCAHAMQPRAAQEGPAVAPRGVPRTWDGKESWAMGHIRSKWRIVSGGAVSWKP